MVFSKLRILRPRSIKRGTKADDSLGVTLRPEDCFTIDIPTIGSDHATKDAVFIDPLTRGDGTFGLASVSSVSSVTTNSGSITTLRSRQTAEYTRQVKKKVKARKVQHESMSTFTRSCTNFSCSQMEEENDQTEKGSNGWWILSSFLPDCTSTNQTVEDVRKLQSDDASDVALNVMGEPIQNVETKHDASSPTSSSKWNVSYFRKQDKSTRRRSFKFWNVLRRSNSRGSHTSRSIFRNPSHIETDKYQVPNHA
jgi:hypothetical protein